MNSLKRLRAGGRIRNFTAQFFLTQNNNNILIFSKCINFNLNTFTVNENYLTQYHSSYVTTFYDPYCKHLIFWNSALKNKLTVCVRSASASRRRGLWRAAYAQAFITVTTEPPPLAKGCSRLPLQIHECNQFCKTSRSL